VTVPVRESDMIFSVIGENFGFIGCAVVILLYFLLIYQMIRVTFDTKNEFYAYISTGVIMMILIPRVRKYWDEYRTITNDRDSLAVY
jgi:rod shape determining protein RodA